MIDSGIYWTFPVPFSDELIVSASDWGGLLLLNSTAAWIWKHVSAEDLPVAYADHFGVSLDQAESDIQRTKASWQFVRLPKEEFVPSPLIQTEPYYRGLYRINEIVFEVSLDTDFIAADVMPRLAPVEVIHPTTMGLSAAAHSFKLSEFVDGTAVFQDAVHVTTQSLVSGARIKLLEELTRLAVPNREFKALIHAGAVGGSDCCAILAGASFSGKSTLCTALMQSGLLCYSDDSVCLTANFQVAGMPFAISLREGSWPLFPHLQNPRFLPSNLNGTSPEVRAVGLIFVDYDPDAQTTTIESVSTSEALPLLDGCGYWVEHTKSTISAFLDWLANMPIRRLRYSNLQEAVSEVRALLSDYGRRSLT